MPAKRSPTKLRALRGLPAAAARNTGGIGSSVAPPEWLPAGAKAEWARVVSACAQYPTWLQEIDRAALAGYAMSWHTFAEAARDVVDRGVLVPGRSSADAARAAMVKNPALQVMREAQASMRAWARELGFTPDARCRIDRGVQETPDPHRDDLLSALLSAP